MRNLILATTFLSACTVVQGSGNLATEARTVPSFSAVEANDGTEVDLVVDPQLTGDVVLEVSTDDNLLDQLTTEVTRGTLVVDTKGNTSTRLGLMVTAEVGPLEAVTGRDGAVLTVDNLSGSALDATAMDGAVVRLEGTTGALVVDAMDGAVLEADALTAETADVTVSDGAVANVCVTGRVTGVVRDGAVLDVSCGGNASGVRVSDGGVVRD